MASINALFGGTRPFSAFSFSTKTRPWTVTKSGQAYIFRQRAAASFKSASSTRGISATAPWTASLDYSTPPGRFMLYTAMADNQLTSGSSPYIVSRLNSNTRNFESVGTFFRSARLHVITSSSSLPGRRKRRPICCSLGYA